MSEKVSATFSTPDFRSFLSDKIRFNMDSGLFTGVVLIDLQKAFDTVDHGILASKLHAMGIDRPAVTWFESYLSERKQFVEMNNSHSSKHGNVTCGVPQGSILGPLLFTIYVNDMVSSVKCDLFLYADDSALVISGKNPKSIEASLGQELESLSIWLEENRLSLHLGKTESILFASKRKLRKHKELSVSCNGINVKPKKCVKYLGVNLDQDLSGNTTLVIPWLHQF